MSLAAPEPVPVTRALPLASWARDIRRSGIQEMLSRMARPGLLSFALGLPAAELFPSEALATSLSEVLRDDTLALQYEIPRQRLKAQVVELMALRGVSCREEQIFLTTGAQQGMSLLARLLLDQHAPVLLEECVYSGMRQVLEPFEPDILLVPTDAQAGIDVDALEAHLQRGVRPAFLYTMSDGHNPLGLSLESSKRERLARIAREYGLPIIEDDAYGLLQYGDVLPPMRALEDRWIFYVGSFSKILAPGLRMGWLVVPEELTQRLSIIKEASDIDTMTLAQRAASAFLAAGHLPAHLQALRIAYAQRRDAMLRALEAHFPQGSRWSIPRCGMFVWVELPEGLDTAALFIDAVENEKIAFLPGEAFRVPGGRPASRGMRLCFASCSPERIEDGIARLGRLAHQHQARLP